MHKISRKIFNKNLILFFLLPVLSFIFVFFSPSQALASPNSNTNKIILSPNSLEFSSTARKAFDSSVTPGYGIWNYVFANYSQDFTGTSYSGGPGAYTQDGHSKDLTITNNSSQIVNWVLETNSIWCVAGLASDPNNASTPGTGINGSTAANSSTQITVTVRPNNGNQNWGPFSGYNPQWVVSAGSKRGDIDNCVVTVKNGNNPVERDWISVDYNALVFSPWDEFRAMMYPLGACQGPLHDSSGNPKPLPEQWACTYYGEYDGNGPVGTIPDITSVFASYGYSTPSWSFTNSNWQNVGSHAPANGRNIIPNSGYTPANPAQINQCIIVKVNPPGSSPAEYCTALCWGQITGASSDLEKDHAPTQSYMLTSNPSDLNFCGGPTCTPNGSPTCRETSSGSGLNDGYQCNPDSCGNQNCYYNTTACPLPGAPIISLNPTVFNFTSAINVAPSAQSLTITNTGDAVLNWQAVTDSSWCRLNGTNNSGSITGTAAANNGSSVVSVTVDARSTASTYNCTITVTDTGGQAQLRQASVNYTVTSGSVPTVSISANPTSGTVGIVNPGLTWSATNSPTSCTASGDWSGAKAVSGTNVSQGVLNTVKTYTYTLVCSNASGSSAPASANVVVSSSGGGGSVPTVSISANPTSGTTGVVNPTITWSATNSPTSCTASGDWSGNKNPAGSSEAQGVLNTVKTYTYTLVCSNASGASAPASANVVVSSSGGSCNVTVNKNGQGTVASSPSGISCGPSCQSQQASFTCGTVTLTATPATNRIIFAGWTGDCTGSANPYVLTANSNKTCTAKFIVNPLFQEF